MKYSQREQALREDLPMMLKLMTQVNDKKEAITVAECEGLIGLCNVILQRSMNLSEQLFINNNLNQS